ncbi:hypothetical protein FBULB1_1409 [Fusarium bulbicola]|nr:hypothetical protein FBULB1_1409 [Fusarium bulbicola]
MPRRNNGRTDWIRIGLPRLRVDKIQRILLTGLTGCPNINELRLWMSSRLGVDNLLAVTARTIRVGMFDVFTIMCKLAMTEDMSPGRIIYGLDGSMFGYQVVRAFAERCGGDGGASKTALRQNPEPVVVIGSSKLPVHWPINSSAPSGCQLPTWPYAWGTTQPAGWAPAQHQPIQDDVKAIHVAGIPKSKFSKPDHFLSTNTAVDQESNQQHYHHHPRSPHQTSSGVGCYPQSRPGLRQPYRHHQRRQRLPKKHQTDGSRQRQSPSTARSTWRIEGQTRFPKAAPIQFSPKANSGEFQMTFQPEAVSGDLPPENVKHASTEPGQNDMPSVEWPASSRGKIVRLRGRPGAHVAADQKVPMEVEPIQPRKQQLPPIREALPGFFTKNA